MEQIIGVGIGAFFAGIWIGIQIAIALFKVAPRGGE